MSRLVSEREMEVLPSSAEEYAEPEGRLLPQERFIPLTPTLVETAHSLVGGAYREHWESMLTIDARIVEVSSETVVLDCLIDRPRRIIEERELPRNLFEGVVPLAVGSYVVVRLFTRPGKYQATFFDGTKRVDKRPFEEVPGLDELEDFDFDRRLL